MPTEQKMIRDAMSEKIVMVTEALVTDYGVEGVNVRRILQTLGISNRVFYNRFHNIDEVLDEVYRNMAERMRESILSKIDPDMDFFLQVTDIVTQALIMSYNRKMRFSGYVFENDSVSDSNYEWWIMHISALIDYGKAKGFVKDVQSKKVAYAIWCFCRGYNADAVGRGLPKDEAVALFRYSFGFLLEGLKA